MALKLFNTLGRKKQEFKPIKKAEVGFYSCGPTVYNYAHIGNLRTYIFSDILKRTLLYNGFKVKHVMNITDVGHLVSDTDSGEEKMELAARREKKSAWEIAKFYTKAFKEDIARLNILPPNIWCIATDHIKEMIELVKKLEKNGFTYVIPDQGIYYDTSKFKDYGKLAKLKIEGLKAGARVEVVKGKKNVTDFALWKFSPKDRKREMEWESPWGKGFPGWHIECSAMSMKYLGENYDIHTGAIDLIPVHHTNEIAQSEGATGKKFVNYWTHGEFILLDKEKMAKTGGVFVILQALIDKGYDALDYRYFVLGAHYRSKLNFSWQAIDGAKNSWNRLKDRIIAFREDKTDKKSKSSEKYKKDFLEAINDDLNMPVAMRIVWAIVKDDSLGNKQKLELLELFDNVLGLGIKDIKEEKIKPELMKLVKEREQARKAKDWKKADKLRDELKKQGIIVEDTPKGQKWKKM